MGEQLYDINGNELYPVTKSECVKCSINGEEVTFEECVKTLNSKDKKIQESVSKLEEKLNSYTERVTAYIISDEVPNKPIVEYDNDGIVTFTDSNWSLIEKLIQQDGYDLYASYGTKTLGEWTFTEPVKIKEYTNISQEVEVVIQPSIPQVYYLVSDSKESPVIDQTSIDVPENWLPYLLFNHYQTFQNNYTWMIYGVKQGNSLVKLDEINYWSTPSLLLCTQSQSLDIPESGIGEQVVLYTYIDNDDTYPSSGDSGRKSETPQFTYNEKLVVWSDTPNEAVMKGNIRYIYYISASKINETYLYDENGNIWSEAMIYSTIDAGDSMISTMFYKVATSTPEIPTSCDDPEGWERLYPATVNSNEKVYATTRTSITSGGQLTCTWTSPQIAFSVPTINPDINTDIEAQ